MEGLGSRLSRDLKAAKEAYALDNPEASKLAHLSSEFAQEQHQGATGEYIQAVVFGGLDGIITTFAVVVAAASSKLSYGTILIIGFANLLADALGMGVGDFLSTKAEEDHAIAEKKREQWELDNAPEVEKQEMIDIYVKKGISEADAKEIVDLLFQSKGAFLDIMMIEELGILPKEEEGAAWKGAAVTFSSFVILGGIPMLPYLFSGHYKKQAGEDAVFWSSIVLFAICLFILGAYKGKITGKKWWVTGVTMLLNGTVTTAIAYIVGWALQYV